MDPVAHTTLPFIRRRSTDTETRVGFHAELEFHLQIQLNTICLQLRGEPRLRVFQKIALFLFLVIVSCHARSK